MKISELFEVASARSKGAEDYDLGNIPFVTSTTLNNGVDRYVSPFPDDKLFEGPSICISGLGYATVQSSTFLPKGNGGDSATILTPIETMSAEILLYYAALFNLLHSWRFSFGRKASIKRIEKLELTPSLENSEGNFKEKLRAFSISLKEQVESYADQVLV